MNPSKNPARGDDKGLKKDQSSVDDTRQEIGEEIHSGGTQPQRQQPNRDKARGDWDRSGVHHDEGTSRADDEPS